MPKGRKGLPFVWENSRADRNDEGISGNAPRRESPGLASWKYDGEVAKKGKCREGRKKGARLVGKREREETRVKL